MATQPAPLSMDRMAAMSDEVLLEDYMLGRRRQVCGPILAASDMIHYYKASNSNMLNILNES